MAQLDRFISMIFNYPDATLSIAAGAEPALIENRKRTILVERVLQAVQVRFLIGEVLDAPTRARLESLGWVDGFYVPAAGQPSLVRVRSWHTDRPEAMFVRPPPAPSSLSPEPPAAAPAAERAAEVTAPATATGAMGTAASTPPEPLEADLTVAAMAQAEAPSSLDEMLTYLVQEKGSDLHLSASQIPMLRLDGSMKRIPGALALSEEQLIDFVRPTMPARNREQFDADNDTDYAYELAGVARFRINLYRDRLGPCLVARAIPSKVLTAEELNLPEAVRSFATLSKGLVLVTGPTGSGKSTTLAALIDLVNREREDHIITLEDPIEFVHVSRRSLVNQREVGVHTNDFKRALRAALREDPDVILVGELRDLETMAIAVETAETGHLVFGTLHTTTAASTVDRIIDSFPPEQQLQVRAMLAESLKGVVAQTLCKRTEGGRVAALEILLGTPAVANLIREGKTVHLPSVMQTSKKLGMTLLNDALITLVQAGRITPREAYLRAVDKTSLVNELTAAGHSIDR